MSARFLVHHPDDTVAVLTTDVSAGEEVTGWLMSNDATLSLQVTEDVPLGHKVALVPIGNGDTIIKYGSDIGRAIADIALGAHVHVHNIKTKRW